MDIVFEKKEFTAGQEVRGRFVVPQDPQQVDHRLCFPQVRVRLAVKESSQIDRGNSQSGGLVGHVEDDTLRVGNRVAQEVHTIWEEEVTVSRVDSDQNQPTHEWTYPFEMTIPERLPATRTFRKPHVQGYGADISRLYYVMHVSVPPVQVQKENHDIFLPVTDFLESSVDLATNIMREACVHSSFTLGKDMFSTDFGVNNTKANQSASAGKSADETESLWRRLSQTWEVSVRSRPRPNPVNIVELHVGPHQEVPQEPCFCGLFDSTRLFFPLVPVSGQLFESSRGQILSYTVADPHGNFPSQYAKTDCEIHVKICQTIHWSAQGHPLMFPIRKEWKMPPSKVFVAAQQSPSNEEGLVTGEFRIPSEASDSYQGKLVQVETYVIFSILVDGTLTGSSPRMTLDVRG